MKRRIHVFSKLTALLLGGLFINSGADAAVTVFGNQQHFVYRDGNGAIQDAWWTGGTSNWSLQQLNLGSKTTGDVATDDPFASVFNQQLHFAYRDGNGAIQDAWFDGARNQWNLQQINLGGRTRGPSAAGNPFVFVFGNQQHFVYRDSSGTVWDAFYDNRTNRWNLQQINVIPDGCILGRYCLGNILGQTAGPPAAGDPFVSVYGQQQHFVYRDSNGVIQDAVYDSASGIWSLQQNCIYLPFRATCSDGIGPGGVAAPVAAGEPFVSVFNNQQHFVYRDVSGLIQDQWWDGVKNTWNLQQIKLGGPASNSAAGNPFVYVVAKEIQVPSGGGYQVSHYQEQHFTYRDKSGNIWDACYNCESTWAWSLHQVSSGGDGASDPFVSAFNNQLHVAYRAVNGTIQDMYAPSLIVQTMGATQGTNYSSWSREEVLPQPPKVTGGGGGGTGGGNGNLTLALKATPVPLYLANALQINIDEITWVVTPDWPGGLSQTIVARQPGAPYATRSVTLSAPSGLAARTVTVTISGKWSTPGGVVGGFTIDPQSGIDIVNNNNSTNDSKTVAFISSNEEISWDLSVPYTVDQGNNDNDATLTYSVLFTFGAIQP